MLSVLVSLLAAFVPAVAAPAAHADPARAEVCGSPGLRGPDAPPAGAVVVPAGRLSGSDLETPGATYWFAPGVHTLAPGEYSQLSPAEGATFVGAPGAVLDGNHDNRYAFTGRAKNVTIRHLTITGFAAPRDEGVVNHDSGDGWVVEHNTLTGNDGAALMAGAANRITGNCLRDNGQYGLNAYQAGNGIRQLLVEGNEFTGNNTADWESKVEGCGCTGAMKFWAVDGADVRGNWIHDNRGPGLWADTNNNDFLVEDNVIENNDDVGIFYEISYNAAIRGNELRRNGWVSGRLRAEKGDPFPVGAIYLSEAGGDARVPARFAKLEISGNQLEDNWDGIVGWANADRFCNSPASTTSDCTRPVGPSNTSRCAAPGISFGAAVPRLSLVDVRSGHPRQRLHLPPGDRGLLRALRPDGAVRQRRHGPELVPVPGRRHPARHRPHGREPLARQQLRGALAVHGGRHGDNRPGRHLDRPGLRTGLRQHLRGLTLQAGRWAASARMAGASGEAAEDRLHRPAAHPRRRVLPASESLPVHRARLGHHVDRLVDVRLGERALTTNDGPSTPPSISSRRNSVRYGWDGLPSSSSVAKTRLLARPRTTTWSPTPMPAADLADAGGEAVAEGVQRRDDVLLG